MNVVKEIRRFDLGREPQRLALKYARMRGGPDAFLRATCHLFAARLPDPSWLRKAPAAWACGDLHLENFGSYRGEDGQVHFDINDFDEALLAPAPWDLLRLLASVIVCRDTLHRGSDAAEARGWAAGALDAYAAALVDGKARWVARETAPEPIASLLEAVRHRDRAAFLDARTERRGARRTLRLDTGKALAASPADRQRVTGFLAAFAATQPEPRHFEVIDVARRIAGLGSLGLERYVVLVRGKGSPDRNELLDLKQVRPPSARARVPQPRWGDEAERVVALQQRLQAVAMAFLHPVRIGDAPFVLRALQPSEDRVTLGGRRPPRSRRENLLAVQARCLAWAQLRSSGRQGSATADALAGFAAGAKWRARTLALACEAADQVEKDWRAFAQAYDEGAFAP